MKFSKTHVVTDSIKGKLKHASSFIRDKTEAVNKRWGIGEITSERAHFFCTTVILLCIFFTTYGVLRHEELDQDSVYVRKVKAVLVFMAAMSLLVIMVVILDKLGACCCDRMSFYVILYVLISVISLCPFLLKAFKNEVVGPGWIDSTVIVYIASAALLNAHLYYVKKMEKRKEEEEKEKREQVSQRAVTG